jgi:hypothetical protein
MPENWDAYHEKEYFALEALRQAIEQAEKQERVPESWMGITDNPYCDDADCNDPNGRAMRWHDKLLALHKQEIKQEPVPVGMTCKVWTHGCALFDGIDLPNETLLYTAPPKRIWVGLTDEEIHKIIDDCTPNEAELEELNDFAKAIFAVEAKLKERNT